MALYNDATKIDPSRFNRTDLRYGFGITFGTSPGGFQKASTFFQEKSIPNPKILVLNPQNIQHEEPVAVQITPTQNGGLVIENRGHILKRITVAGTTGFLPLRARVGLGGVLNLRDAIQRGNAPNLDGIGRKSGYFDIHELKNLFREYGRIKRTRPDIANDIFMVFLNGKDNEHWIVEPHNFRLSRAVPRKTLYNYSIPMTAVARFDTLRRPNELNDNPSDFSKTLQKIADATRLVDNLILDLEASATIFSIDVQKEVNKIVSFGNSYSTAAADVLNGVASIVNILPSVVNDLATAILDTINVAETALVNLPISLTESLLRTLHSVNAVQVREDVFRQTFPKRWEAVTKRWTRLSETLENTFKGQKTRSSMTAAREHTVLGGETITRFAQRTLGDAARFMDVVILNKLRPPYIVDSKNNRPSGTVAPGDKLLVPAEPEIEYSQNPISITLEETRSFPTLQSFGTAGSTATTLEDATQRFIENQWAGFTVEIINGTGIGQVRFIESNDNNELTISPDWTITPDTTSEYRVFLDPILSKQVPGAEALYGVDLKLAKDFDLIVTPESDVALIRGIENLAQAIDIKFSVEPGELPLHPDFGFNAGLGFKGTADQILLVKAFATRNFLNDPRIEDVEDISITLENGTVSIVSKLIPKSSPPKFVDLTLPG